MNHEVTYETIDWEIETRRIAAAFGQTDSIELVHGPSSTSIELCIENRVMTMHYSQNGYDFTGKGHVRGNNPMPLPIEIIIVSIGWDGSISDPDAISYNWPTLGKGLILLGLLSPEMQTELGCPFSAHEILEWKLEYDARIYL